MNPLATDARPAIPFNLTGRKIWVAGSTGLVGQALLRRLASEGCEVLAVPREQLDLRRQSETEAWLLAHRPEGVIVAAATVGGIRANIQRPGEFLYDNLTIASNIVEGCRKAGVEKVLLLGSSCIYPREASDPIAETALLTGELEPTNEPYALAKIAALKLGEAYRRQYGLNCIAAMPTNLYGPGDSFDLESSHVVPALLRKIHEAWKDRFPEAWVWGSGRPRREFMHVDDCADALVHLFKVYSGPEIVNVGTGTDVSIRELAELLARIVGFEGTLRFDPSQPDGMPRKRLNVSRLERLGWVARIPLEQGLRATYAWYLAQTS
jgi:GDP-L-fucose synthase